MTMMLQHLLPHLNPLLKGSAQALAAHRLIFSKALLGRVLLWDWLLAWIIEVRTTWIYLTRVDFLSFVCWLETYTNCYVTGILSCLDGYMNIALEQTEEHVNGTITNRYGDAFIRGNNGRSLFRCTCLWLMDSQFCTSQLQRHYKVRLLPLWHARYWWFPLEYNHLVVYAIF